MPDDPSGSLAADAKVDALLGGTAIASATATDAGAQLYPRAARWHLARASRAGHWLDTTIPEQAIEQARDFDDHVLRASRLAFSLVLAIAALGIIAGLIGLVDVLDHGDQAIAVVAIVVSLVYSSLLVGGVLAILQRPRLGARRSALRILAYLGGAAVIIAGIGAASGLAQVGRYAWGGSMEFQAVATVCGFMGSLVSVGMLAMSRDKRWRVLALGSALLFLVGAWLESGGTSIALSVFNTDASAAAVALTVWGVFAAVTACLPANAARRAARGAIRAWWLIAMLTIVVTPTAYFVSEIEDSQTPYLSYEAYDYGYADERGFELEIWHVQQALGLTVLALTIGLIPMVTMVAWPALMSRFGWRRRWRREMRRDVVKAGAGTLEHALLELDMRRERGEIDDAVFAAESRRLLEGAASPGDDERPSRMHLKQDLSTSGPSAAEEQAHLDRLPPAAIVWLARLHASVYGLAMGSAVLASVAALVWIATAAAGIRSDMSALALVTGAGLLLVCGLYITIGRLPATQRGVTVALTTISGIALCITWAGLRLEMESVDTNGAAALLQFLWLVILFLAGRGFGGAGSRGQDATVFIIAAITLIAAVLAVETEDSRWGSPALTAATPLIGVAALVALVGLLAPHWRRQACGAIIVLFVIQCFTQDMVIALADGNAYTHSYPQPHLGFGIGAAGALSMAMAVAWGLNDAAAHWRRRMFAYPPPVGMTDAREYDLVVARYRENPGRYQGVQPAIGAPDRLAPVVEASLGAYADKLPKPSRRARVVAVGSATAALAIVAGLSFGLPALHRQQQNDEYEALLKQVPIEARDPALVLGRVPSATDDEIATTPLIAIANQISAACHWYSTRKPWRVAEDSDTFYAVLNDPTSIAQAKRVIAEHQTALLSAFDTAESRPSDLLASQPTLRDYSAVQSDVALAFTAFEMRIDLLMLEGRIDDALRAWVRGYALAARYVRDDPTRPAVESELQVRDAQLSQLERILAVLNREEVSRHRAALERVIADAPQVATDARLRFFYDATLCRGLDFAVGEGPSGHARRMALLQDAMAHRDVLATNHPQRVATLEVSKLAMLGSYWMAPSQVTVELIVDSWALSMREAAALWVLEWLAGEAEGITSGTTRSVRDGTVTWTAMPGGDIQISAASTFASTSPWSTLGAIWQHRAGLTLPGRSPQTQTAPN